jgi:hypothetical protein
VATRKVGTGITRSESTGITRKVSTGITRKEEATESSPSLVGTPTAPEVIKQEEPVLAAVTQRQAEPAFKKPHPQPETSAGGSGKKISISMRWIVAGAVGLLLSCGGLFSIFNSVKPEEPVLWQAISW